MVTTISLLSLTPLALVTVTGTFFTSSTADKTYYLDVYNDTIGSTNSAIQFSIAYGHIYGSGSAPINSLVPGVSPTRINFGQYRNIIFGDAETNFNFGTGNNNSPDIFVINLSRANYKEKLFLSTFSLTLSGSVNVSLTNNSANVSTLTYCDAGRVYDIVSGTNGTAVTQSVASGVTPGYTVSGSYGYYLPDVDLIVLNPRALALPHSQGGVNIQPYFTQVTGSDNTNVVGPSGSISKLFCSISGSPATTSSFQLNSEENVSSDYVFVRAINSEFNYSTNPSNITGSGTQSSGLPFILFASTVLYS